MLKKFIYIFSNYMIFGFEDRRINKKFLHWKQENSYKQITYISLVTGVLYILLSFINRYTAPQEIANFIANVQLFLIAPYILIVSYLGHKKKNFFYVETLLFLAPLLASSMHLIIISKLDSFNTYQVELYLMIFWIFTISGLRLVHSLITSIIVYILGGIGAYILYNSQIDQLIIHIAWMSVSMIFGFSGGFLLQDAQKNTFLKQMELEKIATIDKLTGLNNRVRFDKILNNELQRALRYKNKLGLMIIDIDQFKEVNDTYGHQVGDEVLVKLSNALKKNMRKSDTIFRWGGEEFIIIALEVNEKTLSKIAQHLRKVVERLNFDKVGQKTISIGTTLSTSEDNLHSLIKRADKALYKAKEANRNCVKFIP